MTMSYVLPLHAVGADDVGLAGGKGANLGELVRAGFAVPRGFVATTALYAEALRSAELDPATSATSTSARAGLESAVRELVLPPDLAAVLVDAYHDLGGGPVAVRSSATAEDLAGAAFAGQQETFLNVVGADALLEAVRACWASLWAERAVAYRRQVGFTDVLSTAVVVQRMVPSEHAGVLFTADPVTGARDVVVIDASPGLGEAVVSGLVTPEHVVVDRHGHLRERRAGRAEVVLRGAAGGGVAQEELAGDAATRLGDETFRGLAATGRRIEAHFGRPQDVEWAYADETVWVVQARPLTALPPAPLEIGPVRRTSAAICAELLPTRPYPLDLTAWTVPGWFAILRRMASEIGGVEIDVGRMLPAVDGVLSELRPPEPRPTWRTFTAPLRLVAGARRSDPSRWTADPRFAAYERGLAGLRSRDLATASWADLLAVPAEALALLDGFVDLRIDHLYAAVVHMARFRVLLGLLGLSTELWPLLAGAPTRTRAANEALAALAAQIDQHPVWREDFRSAGEDELAATVWGSEAYRPLRVELQGWLEEFGHRETTSAALVSSPTWADEPGLLLGGLRALVGRPAVVGVDAQQDDDRVAAALGRVRRRRRVRVTGSADRVGRVAEAARAALAFREDSHFHALRVRPVLRAALLQAGRRLTDAGLLARPEEVFQLELDELRALDEPARLTQVDVQRVRETVRRRASRRAELGHAPLISPATLHPGTRRPAPDGLVSGTPGGGGRARGVVRVVRGPDEFDRLQPGDVLVCPYTNPAWTPLFALVSAVVADSGSSASHAAIVAREYGVPAVMGTGNGTSVLADGQAVLVDGDRGVVLTDPEGGARG